MLWPAVASLLLPLTERSVVAHLHAHRHHRKAGEGWQNSISAVRISERRLFDRKGAPGGNVTPQRPYEMVPVEIEVSDNIEHMHKVTHNS